jgi:putative endonuclease
VGRTNRDTGKLGEKIAEKFLTSRGYRILDRNFSTPFGEIDLVARQAGFTVFFEVKTRLSERFGSPLLAITGEKKEHIIKNCQYYLKRYGLNDNPCRIDAISINLRGQGELKELRHIKNAIMIN